MAFTWPVAPPVPVLARPQRTARATPQSADLERLRSALDAIPNCGTAELDYDRWVSVVFGVHNATDGSDEGLELAHEFSSRASKYDAGFLDERIWPYIRTDRDGGMHTAETVYAQARAHGWDDPSFADGFECIEDPQSGDDPSQSGNVLPHENPFAIVHAAEFRQSKPLQWIVKDVIPQESSAMVFGPSGSGKSFVLLDICFAVAGGAEEWRGKRVHGGKVLYVVAEGAAGFRKRLEAYAIEHDVDLSKVQLYVLPAAPNFTSRTAVQQVIAAAQAIGGFRMIVVDTLARVAVGVDENSAQEMGVVIANAEAIGRATGATIVVVHHSGKDVAKGARGSGAIKGAVDAEIEVARADHDRSLTVTKMRDGEDGARFGFRLRTVELGEDDEGEKITSCVVEHVDCAPTRAKRLGRTKQLVVDAVRDGFGLDGSLPTPEGVIEACVPLIASEPRVARQTAKRALNALLEDGTVVLEAGGLTLGKLNVQEKA